MRRRALIAAAGTAVSTANTGCLEAVLGAPGRRVRLQDIGRVGDDHPLELDAALRSRRLGPESAPAIEVTLRSVTDAELLLDYAETWPADGLLPVRNSEPPGLRLLAARTFSDLTVRFGDCPHTEYHPITADENGRGHVQPGDEHAVRYRVVGSAPALDGDCPPPGRYRVGSTYRYKRAAAVEENGYADAPAHRFTWGFTIEVPESAG